MMARHHKSTDVQVKSPPSCKDIVDMYKLVKHILNIIRYDNDSAMDRVSNKYLNQCRTIIKSGSNSNYAIITSCCEPQLHVMKDQWTEISPSILEAKDVQTVLEPQKQLRSQSIQTEYKGKHTNVQTGSSHSIHSFLRNCLDNKTQSLDKDIEHHTDIHNTRSNDDELSFLKNLFDLQFENGSQKSEKGGEYPGKGAEETAPSVDYIKNILVKSSIFSIDITDKNNESAAVKITSDDKYSSSITCGEARGETDFESTSSHQYFEARDPSKTWLHATANNNSQQYFKARDNFEDENQRTSIFINKKPSQNMEDDMKSSSYHTPPRDSDHVKFNIDFNKDELLSRIFELTDDDNHTFVTQSDVTCSPYGSLSPKESLYNDALDISKDNNYFDDDIFQSFKSAFCDTELTAAQHGETSFHIKRNLEISEIPYNVRVKESKD
ncbi:hypothetical protein M8J76_012503 [Diaphorina citri]|nr:hypothetical protein M8J76_012503 [Diaphorina citri]